MRGIAVRGSRTLAAAPRRPGARRVAIDRGGLRSALSASFPAVGLTGWETPGGFSGGMGGDGGGGSGGGGY